MFNLRKDWKVVKDEQNGRLVFEAQFKDEFIDEPRPRILVDLTTHVTWVEPSIAVFVTYRQVRVAVCAILNGLCVTFDLMNTKNPVEPDDASLYALVAQTTAMKLREDAATTMEQLASVRMEQLEKELDKVRGLQDELRVEITKYRYSMGFEDNGDAIEDSMIGSFDMDYEESVAD